MAMKKGTYVLLIFLFFFLVAAAGLFFLFVSEIGPPAAEVPARAYLEVGLSGAVEEVAPPDLISTLFARARPLTTTDIWANLRKAAVDDRVRAVLLRVGSLQCDWGKAAEIREAVLEFRRSGKKAYAYIEEAPDSDKEYYVATACDRVVLHPLGWLGVIGIGGYVPFFKGALDKLGVRAEFEDGWGLVRCSNTTPSLSLRFEADTPPALERIQGIFRDQIKAAAPEVTLPF